MTFPFQGKDLTLLQLLNPNGQSDFTGGFSPSSPYWKEAKQEMPPLRPGHFWISTKDISRLFSNMFVCKVKDDCKYFSGGKMESQYKDYEYYKKLGDKGFLNESLAIVGF